LKNAYGILILQTAADTASYQQNVFYEGVTFQHFSDIYDT